MHVPRTSSSAPSTAPQTAAPTWVRWQIVGLLMLTAAVCHFNRVSMSVAGSERIIENHGIDPQQMGFVYSAYLLLYALCMTPGGWFIDRRGPRAALALLGFGSAVFVTATGLGGKALASVGLLLPGLLVIRALLGVVSAPVHPGAARAVSYWIPVPARSWANGLVTGAACVGMASTYFAFGYLMDRFDDWAAAFVVSGVGTALLAVVWTVYATDAPSQHRWVNEPERDLIRGERRTVQATADFVTRPDRGWTALLTQRSLVCLTLSYAAVGYFQYLFFYWMQFYFLTKLKMDKGESRLYSTVCTLAMGAGMLLGGWLADRLQAHWGRRKGRAVVAAGGMFASAALLGLGLVANEPGWIVLWFALAMAAVGATEGPFWTTAVELGGQRGGTAAAICNTGGNVGGLLAPVLTPLLAEQVAWSAAISAGSLVCLLGAGLWAWVDPDEA